MEKLELLTTQEVVELLQVTKQTLFNWRVKGLIKCRKIGRKNLYLKSDILKALEETK